MELPKMDSSIKCKFTNKAVICDRFFYINMDLKSITKYYRIFFNCTNN